MTDDDLPELIDPPADPEDDDRFDEDGSPKRPSGAAKRKAAREKKDAELDGEVGGSEDFEVLGDPDLTDPSTALEYVRRAQLIAFGQICRSKTIPTRERWRLIKEYGAVLGMTHNRAELEARTKKLEGLLKAKQAAGAVRFERGVKKPPTARGGAPAPLKPVDDGPPDIDDDRK